MYLLVESVALELPELLEPSPNLKPIRQQRLLTFLYLPPSPPFLRRLPVLHRLSQLEKCSRWKGRWGRALLCHVVEDRHSCGQGTTTPSATCDNTALTLFCEGWVWRWMDGRQGESCGFFQIFDLVRSQSSWETVFCFPNSFVGLLCGLIEWLIDFDGTMHVNDPYMHYVVSMLRIIRSPSI